MERGILGCGSTGKGVSRKFGGATRRIDQNAVGKYVTYYENPIRKSTILQVNLDNKNQNKKEAMSTKEKCPISHDIDLFFHGPEYAIKVVLKLPLSFRKIFALLSLFGCLNE